MDCGVAVYEHAARLIDRRPWDVSRDGELLFQAHAEAYRRYRHSPVVVSIDIYNLEAEAYGATVAEPAGNGIPAVVKPICPSAEQMGRLEPFDPARAGRIPITLEAAARLAEEFPEADVRVPMAGPMSIASILVGFETLLCEMVTDPQAVAAALEHLVAGQVNFCRAIHRAGLDVAFFESAAAPPLMSPDMFRRIELPPLKSIIRQSSDVVGHPIPCVMGGNTEPILEALLETGTGYLINPIETDQQAFMTKIWDRTDVRVRVNASPGIMAGGTREAIRDEVQRIAKISAGRPNVCFGTSALPYETPPENVLWVQELCRSL
jgi:uroporphyrinogen decarboxylase